MKCIHGLEVLVWAKLQKNEACRKSPVMYALFESTNFVYLHFNTEIYLDGMKIASALIFCSFVLFIESCQSQTEKTMKLNHLTPEEEYVILHKGTEPPFTGIYTDHKEPGTYMCKQCDTPLFLSTDKFDSHCGWPSFDDQIPGNVKMLPDADGHRTEIVCANCNGHLGHVFYGEGFTNKQTRYCVNSISMEFNPVSSTHEHVAYFAAGCFWGVEYYLQKAKGVISATSGYMGGTLRNPTYEEICTGRTDHAETVKVVYNPAETNFEKLARLFFEIHDFTQVNRQGPDVGTQYRSVIFYADQAQKSIAEELIQLLEKKGYKVATKLEPASTFWEAEQYHQEYYFRKGGVPYCHSRREVF
jgi:peptide methionine sulfoxide reductase msrA/msrB